MDIKLLLGLSAALGVFLSFSQIMLARAARAMLSDVSAVEYVKNPLLLIRIDFIAAVALYVLATFTYMYLLTKGGVITVYATMLSVALITTYVLASVAFGEQFQMKGLIGIVFICAGVWMVVR